MNADISERIKNLRKEKGLNQEEFGKILGISRRSISAIENGETDLSTNQIKIISEFFKISKDYLIDGKESENKINEIEQEIIQLVRKDLDVKESLIKILETKKKIINRMMMTHNHELMVA